MKKLLLLLFTLHLSIFFGQYTAKPADPPRCDSTLIFISSKYSSKFMIGDQRISYDRAVAKLNRFPASAYEFQMHKKFSNAYLASVYTGALAVIAGQIAYAANHKKPDSFTAAMGIVFVVNLPVYITTGILSNKHFKRALRYYNDKVCSVY